MIRIDSSFFEYLSSEGFRDKARRVLIETKPYFLPEERAALYSMLKMKPSPPGIREDEGAYKTSVQAGRDARFRIEVVLIAYRHTCALTGYRMTTLGMGEYCRCRSYSRIS